MNIISVNIAEHGDGKRVYVTVRTDNNGEFTVNGDSIHVHVHRSLARDVCDGAYRPRITISLPLPD